MDVRIGCGKNLLSFLIYLTMKFFGRVLFSLLKAVIYAWPLSFHNLFLMYSHCTCSMIFYVWLKEHFYVWSMLQHCLVVCPSVLTCSKGAAFLWLHWGLKILHILIICGQGWENENWCEILGIRLYWLYCWGYSSVASILTVTYTLSLRTYHPSLNSSSHVVSIICCFSWTPLVEFCLSC